MRLMQSLLVYCLRPLLVLAVVLPLPLSAQDYAYSEADVAVRRNAFIDRMVSEHAFDREVLTDILAGATILPANPIFYTNPKTITELIDTVVARVLDHIGVPNQLAPRWAEELE